MRNASLEDIKKEEVERPTGAGMSPRRSEWRTMTLSFEFKQTPLHRLDRGADSVVVQRSSHTTASRQIKVIANANSMQRRRFACRWRRVFQETEYVRFSNPQLSASQRVS